MTDQPALLEVRGLTRRYLLPRESLLRAPAPLTALDGVDLTIRGGRSLGVVGESGSGKSTLARLVMALERPSAGQVLLEGVDLNQLDAAALKRARRDFQMVFQDPYGSLDPRQRVERIVTEPLRALAETARSDNTGRAVEALESVGLRAPDLAKFPHEFSGGQRQRIAIARALITRPKLIVADEPVSALDVSVQAQVLNLLQDLQARFGVTFLLISHDLAVVDHLCNEVAVIYRGRVVEQGDPDTLFARAAHPYTRALLEAVPRLIPGRRKRRAAAGPAAADLGAADRPAAGTAVIGCAFAPRCRHADELCRRAAPVLRLLDAEHRAACHHSESLPVASQPDA